MKSIMLGVLGVLWVAGGCSGEPPPVLPTPTLQLPGGVMHMSGGNPSWEPQPVAATASTLLVVTASGEVVEVSADGTTVQHAIPSHVAVICARGSWVGWWSVKTIGRRAPNGIVEELAVSSLNYPGIAAGPDGIYWLQPKAARPELWGWTTGAAAVVPIMLDPSFELVAVDDAYVYGDEHPMDGIGGTPFLVRYARATGQRALITERDRFGYFSLQPFVVRGDRMLYDRKADLYVRNLSSGAEQFLGTIPNDNGDEYFASLALAEQRAFYGKYRLTDGVMEHFLGAPPSEDITSVEVLNDKVAWLTEPPLLEPWDPPTPATLYLAPVDLELP